MVVGAKGRSEERERSGSCSASRRLTVFHRVRRGVSCGTPSIVRGVALSDVSGPAQVGDANFLWETTVSLLALSSLTLSLGGARRATGDSNPRPPPKGLFSQ